MAILFSLVRFIDLAELEGLLVDLSATHGVACSILEASRKFAAFILLYSFYLDCKFRLSFCRFGVELLDLS